MRVGTTLLSIGAAVMVAVAQPEGPLDSLLATWPAREALAHLGDPKVVSWIPLDTTLSRARMKSLGTDLPLFQDDAVADAILLFGGPRRNHTELLLGIAAPWMSLMEAELREADLPTDLKFVPLALSAMNLSATSVHGEAGPWMLTWPVAVGYGLQVTDPIDQRHDMVLSTTAAVKYRQDLTARFGKEEALLALLCGPANLMRAKARSHGVRGIAALYPYVDGAERERVPAFMALRYLAHYAEVLGIRPVEVGPVPTDTVRTRGPVRAEAFARVMGIDARTLAELNPVLVGATLPAHTVVRVPIGGAPRYALLVDSIARASTTVASGDTAMASGPLTLGYTVEPGDNLSAIAEEYGVSVAELKEWNELEGDGIRAGTVLRIRVSAPEVEALEREKPEPAPKPVPKKKVPTVRSRIYVVKKGDTLSGIAKRYPGVRVKDIMRHNHVGENIRAGQKLEIPKP